MAQATVSQTRKGYVDRRALGEEMAALGCVRQAGDGRYVVLSPGSGNAYQVTCHPWGSWECTCPDRRYRNAFCKHMWAVKHYRGEGEDYFEPEEEGGEETKGDPWARLR